MEDKKTSVIALLRLLEEETDENHILSEPEISELLKSRYGISLDRRTVYRNVDLLKEFGYDISDWKDNGKGYFLRERTFETSQIFLLCNAIHSSNYIPSKHSSELIDNLLNTQSKYFRNDYKNTVYVQNNNKKENKEFFYNIEEISKAIKLRKSISFVYTRYNLDKQLVSTREERYFVSPYYLVYDDEKTYLVCRGYNHTDLAHYRVDRIKDVKIEDTEYIKLERTQDPYQYSKGKINMFTGNEYDAALKCDNSMIDIIVDRFGKDVPIEKLDSNHFLAYIHSTDKGMVLFALQFLDLVEVVKPKEVRDQVIETLKQATERYKK